jgi:hypothetical protein
VRHEAWQGNERKGREPVARTRPGPRRQASRLITPAVPMPGLCSGAGDRARGMEPGCLSACHL